MWKIYLHFILFIFFLSPIGTSAGTLENADFKNYKVKITYDDGQVEHEILYEQSKSYGLCHYGCTVELMDTGQKMEMKPDDYIVIKDGVLKQKEEL